MSGRASDKGWEQLFQLVFERSLNGIALVEDQRIVNVNEAMVAILGRSRGELVGASVLDVIPPEARPRAARNWKALQRSMEDAGVSTVIRPDGSEVEVEFAARLAAIGGRRLAVFVVTPPWGSRALAGSHTGPDRVLTPREREVVARIALGEESPQIAGELFISQQTVRTHVRNAMSKLGARTRAQLVAIALANAELHLPVLEK